MIPVFLEEARLVNRYAYLSGKTMMKSKERDMMGTGRRLALGEEEGTATRKSHTGRGLCSRPFLHVCSVSGRERPGALVLNLH